MPLSAARTILVAVVAALMLPAAASAQQLGIGDLSAEADGSTVRVSLEFEGPGTADDILVGGSYTADVTAHSSVPGGNCRDHNDVAAQPVVGCEFPSPGVEPGSRVTIDMTNSGPCPPGQGYVVEIRDTDTGASAGGAVPCGRGVGADLGVTVKRDGQFNDDYEISGEPASTPLGLQRLYLTATVTNHGPGTARDAELTVPLDPLIPGPQSAVPGIENFIMLRHRDERSRVRCDQRTCALGTLAPRESRQISVIIYFSEAGELVMPFAATSKTLDPGPKPHRVSYTERVRVLESKIRSASRNGVSGTSSRGSLSTILSIMETNGGRLPSSGTLGEGSAVGCRWLTRLTIRFRFERGRRCNEPEWLRAKGTRRWRLTFKRPLPPGRYTVISSAVRRSAAEATFSRRKGNRRTFTVR